MNPMYQIPALVLSVWGWCGDDDDLLLPDRIRGDRAKEARELTELRARLEKECEAFNEGQCERCPKTHGECETPERCEPICNADLESRVKDLLKREAILRNSVRSSLKFTEVNLRDIHDRIQIYLAMQKALEACGDDADRRRDVWKHARLQAVVAGLGHLKTALRLRLRIFSERFPEERWAALSDAFDRISDSWRSYSERPPRDADGRARALRTMAGGLEEARKQIHTSGTDLKQEAREEFRHLAESLKAIRKGIEEFALWEEEGWEKVEPRVNRVSTEIRGVIQVGFKDSDWQILLGTFPLRKSDAELAEDVDAGPYLVHRGLRYAAWALDLRTYDSLEVESCLEKLGREYECLETLRKSLRKAL